MKEVANNVYQIALFPRNGINCYVIDDILVDAGIRSSATKILNAIKDSDITKHVLTHAHADHQGASSIVCETLNIPLLTSVIEKEHAESGKVIYDYPNNRHWIAKFQQRYWAGSGHKVSHLLREGDEVGSFTVIETPGHSKGHISLFREKDGVLIVGDTLVNMNLLTTISGLHEPPGLFTTDRIENRKSIHKLFNLKPKILCFGHGPVLYDKGEFEQFMTKL